MNNPVINPDFGVQSNEGSQKYPAIQATDYRPKLGDDVHLCLSDNSLGIMHPDWKDYFSNFSKDVCYGTEQETVCIIPETARFVFLGIPKTFAQEKESKQISPLQRGVSLKSINSVTATRCLVAMLVDGNIVLTSDGSIQPFTLKLTSTKTKLIDAYNEPDYRSLKKLNRVLIEHHRLKSGTWTHLVSIGINPTVTVFSNSQNQSSTGILFELAGKPQILDSAMQQTMFHLVNSDEVKEFLVDPFGLKNKQDQVDQGDQGGQDYGFTRQDEMAY